MQVVAKKIAGILAAVVILVSLMAIVASAESFSPDSDPLTYTVISEEEKTVSVSGCAAGQSSVTIPASVSGYTVTKIDKGLFDEDSSLQSLTFADGCQIETIENAFNDCINLNSIDWGSGSSLKEITKSFQGCSALSGLTIPASVETIGEDAFANCIGLTSLDFASGSNLKAIGKEAFAYTGKDEDTVPATITSLTLPASLETLGKSAFHCVPVRNFALEDYSKLTMIPNGFLSADGKEGQPGVGTECNSLLDYVEGMFKSFAFSEPYPFTPAKVAQACDCLESIDLGDYNDLTIIGPGAFKNQTHLTAIDFGQNAAAETLTIKYGAFIAAGNNAARGETLGSGINTLTLPANLSVLDTGCFRYARISNLVFSNGSKLEDIPYGFMAIEGADAAPITNNVYQMDSSLSDVDKAIIIAADSLKTIDFGSSNSLKEIQSGAFKNQSHLTAIDFGSTSNDLTIEYGAFAGVGNNAYLVEQRKDQTLNAGITRVILPSKLSVLQSGAFDMARIKNIEFADGCKLQTIPYGFMSIQGVDGEPGVSDGYTTITAPLTVIYAADCLETIDFGSSNSLKEIQSGAFKNQGHLTGIDFGSSAANLEISYGAFTGAGNNGYLVENKVDSSLNAGIETLVFPANLSSMGSGAFNYAKVKNVQFRDSCRLEMIPYGFMSVEGDDGTPGVYDVAGSYSDKVSQSVLKEANSIKPIKFGKNNSLAEIQTGAFKNQSHLTGIDFGTSTANLTINFGAFAGAGNNGYLVENGTDSSLNAGIETLVFPANLCSFNTGAFNFARVKNVKFSDGCKLRTIPYGFMSIEGDDGMPGSYVFTYASNDKTKQSVLEAANTLKTIDFGKNNSLAEIQTGAFKNQSHLTGIDFGTSTVNLRLYSGAFTGAGNNGYLVDKGKDTVLNDGINTLIMPANLSALDSGCFKNARIKNIKFADGCNLTDIIYGFMTVEGEDGKPGIDPSTHCSYENIPAAVFTAANSLESIDFGDNNSLTSIQNGALRNQTHLTSIDFGTHKSNANLSLQSGAFAGTAPETLVIPARTNYLNSGVFKKAAVKNLVFEDGCRITRLDNGFLCRDYNDENDHPVLQSIDFGNNSGLSYIGDGAFAGNANLKTLDLSKTGVQTICGGAFNDCGLTQITLPPSLSSLRDGAFQGLDDLETLTIGSSCALTKLEGGVFSDCSKLKTVDLENSNITKIDDSLKENPSLVKIILPKKLKSITWDDSSYDSTGEKCPFYGCSNVKEMYFTNTDSSGCSFDNDVLQFLGSNGTVFLPAEVSDEQITAYQTKLSAAGLAFESTKWKVTVPTYTVSFDTNGHGTQPASQSEIRYGSKVTKPADLTENTVEGFSFVGWCKDEDCTVAWDFDTDVVPKDTTIYAKWSYHAVISSSVGGLPEGTSVSITVDDNKADVGEISAEAVENVSEGENVSIDLSSAKSEVTNVSLTQSTIENIANSDADGVEIKLSTETAVKLDTAALGVIVQKAGAASGAAICLELNTGKKAEKSMNDGQKNTVAAMNKPLVVDISISVGATKVSDLEGGKADITVPYSSDKPVNVWYINDLAQKIAVAFDKVGKSITMHLGHNSYYVIEEAALYSVTFDANGHGIAPAVQTDIILGGIVSKPADPAAQGYTFGGWYREAACTNAWDFDNDAVEGNMTLYAKWTEASNSGNNNSGGGGSSSVNKPQTGNNANAKTETISINVGDAGNGPAVSVGITESKAEVGEIKDSDLAEVKAGENVTIDLSSAKNEISSVSLTKSTLDSIASSNAYGVEVKLSNGTVVVFDTAALQAISQQTATDTVSLELFTGEKAQASMNEQQKAAVAGMNNPVVVDISFIAGDKRISDLKGGSTDVTVPYVTDKNVRAWFVDDLAKKASVPCEKNGKTVTMHLGHNSYYVIEETAGFADVSESDYFSDAVNWAYSNNITSGTDDTHFSPENTTTRAQMVTFLWRAAGSPEPELRSLPFEDVRADSYYYKAVLWAAGKGIVNGISENEFAPDMAVTRAQAVTYLYRYEGMDTMQLRDNPFADVAEGQYYYDAVLWANERDITKGTSATEFSPDAECRRGQIVTFLYRYFK